MYRYLIIVLFLLYASDSYSQDASWFLGVWKGAPLSRKKSDDSRLERIFVITLTDGNSFQGYVKVTLKSDTTIHYDSRVSGTIGMHYLTAKLGENYYKKDPPGTRWETRCNSCGPIRFFYSSHDGKFFLTGETTGCALPCNGVSVYSRDTGDLTAVTRVSLEKLFSGVAESSSNANTARQETFPAKSGDTVDNSLPIQKAVPENKIASNDLGAVKSVTLPAKPAPFEKRPSTFIRTYPVQSDSILLRVFDNGIVDGDTVSVFYNDSVVVNRLGLTARAYEIRLPVNKTKDNRIVLYAHNLGSIPPNTAMLEVYTGSTMYSVMVSTDLTMSSGIILKYQKE